MKKYYLHYVDHWGRGDIFTGYKYKSIKNAIKTAESLGCCIQVNELIGNKFHSICTTNNKPMFC